MSPQDLVGSEPGGAASPIKSMDLEAVRGALDELFRLARRYRNSAKYLKLLRFVASFRRYSIFNAVLVYIQMPGAIYVLPAQRWLREYGRLPVPDAQPLVMLRPMGPVMFGFDVSQTEAVRTGGRPLPKGFDNPFSVNGCLKVGEFDLLVDNSRRDGVSVSMKPLGSTLGGYVRNAANPDHCLGIGLAGTSGKTMPVDGKHIRVVAEVTLNANLPPETNFATLTHELGHLYCGHVRTPNPMWWPDRGNLDRNTREFEAESVSYMVCQRAGIDTPAVEYLHCYLGANEEVPKISLDAVFKAAQRIEAMRTKIMKLRAPEVEET